MKKPLNPSEKTNSPDTALISVWVPKALIREIDAMAKQQDSDRSKVVRQAIRKAVRS